MGEHYTKQEITEKDFLFISYKHARDKEAEILQTVFSGLLEKGVRVWYDVDFVNGDKWTEEAESLIKHENCRGVIFFNNVQAFLADAVHKERRWTLEKLQAEKERGRPFYIFPAHADGESNLMLIKKAFDSLEADERTLAKSFPLENLAVITSLFSDSVIFADYRNTEDCIENLALAVKSKIPEAIDTDYLQIKRIEAQVSEEEGTILSLGICKDRPENSIPSYRLQADQTFTEHGERFIVQDGKGYSTKSIEWRFLYLENDVYVLLSEHAVDTRCGGKELNKWLENDFSELAFTENERACIRKIRLLSCEDMQKCSNASEEAFAFPDDTESHWWIADMAMGALQKVIRKNGTVYKSGYNSRAAKSGVRPVIEIQKEDFLKIKTN